MTATVKTATVIVAIDASDQAKDALKYYINTIHKEGNRIILVHVIELPDFPHARENFMTPATLTESWAEERGKARELEKEYTDILKAQNVSLATVKIKEQGGLKPGHEICNAAEAENASMIVMGTRGMGTIRRTIMGSVSDYVIHHAHCPVVVCRK